MCKKWKETSRGKAATDSIIPNKDQGGVCSHTAVWSNIAEEAELRKNEQGKYRFLSVLTDAGDVKWRRGRWILCKVMEQDNVCLMDDISEDIQVQKW